MRPRRLPPTLPRRVLSGQSLRRQSDDAHPGGLKTKALGSERHDILGNAQTRRLRRRIHLVVPRNPLREVGGARVSASSAVIAGSDQRRAQPVDSLAMAVSELYTRAVVFVSGALGPGPADLRGTGFVVSMPTVDPDQLFLYVVTAAHVVRPMRSSVIRLVRSFDGSSIEDLEIPRERWVFHAIEDLAVAPIVVNPEDVILSVIPVSSFAGTAETQFAPGAGDKVVFAGLLGLVPSMGDRNVPMVRTGSIGALHQDELPVRLPDGTVLTMHGHLIDCRSFGGFSGSPCFVELLSGMDRTPRLGLASPRTSTLLLGLVSGHFDIHAPVALPDNEEELRVPVAAGIAVVQAAETIMEVLDDEDLVASRAADNEALASS